MPPRLRRGSLPRGKRKIGLRFEMSMRLMIQHRKKIIEEMPLKRVLTAAHSVLRRFKALD